MKRANNWLCFIDVVNQITNESQNYSLMKFLPFLPVMFHILFASNSPHKIIYPHSQFEVRQIIKDSSAVTNCCITLRLMSIFRYKYFNGCVSEF